MESFESRVWHAVQRHCTLVHVSRCWQHPLRVPQCRCIACSLSLFWAGPVCFRSLSVIQSACCAPPPPAQSLMSLDCVSVACLCGWQAAYPSVCLSVRPTICAFATLSVAAPALKNVWSFNCVPVTTSLSVRLPVRPSVFAALSVAMSALNISCQSSRALHAVRRHGFSCHFVGGWLFLSVRPSVVLIWLADWRLLSACPVCLCWQESSVSEWMGIPPPPPPSGLSVCGVGVGGMGRASFYEDVPLMEFMQLVFTRMPGVSYHRRLRSLLFACVMSFKH